MGVRRTLFAIAASGCIALGAMASEANAEPAAYDPAVPSSQWEFEFRPYGWVLYMSGETTLGAQKADIDTNVFEIIDEVDKLYPFMSYQELRKGRLGLFADVVWSRINVGASTVTSANPIAGLNVTIVADADVWFDFAIVEPGAAFEIASWGGGGHPSVDANAFVPATSLDVIAGARYWYLKPDIDLNVTATVSIPALRLSRTGAGTISAEKVIDWWDPFVGLRLRHSPAPGKQLFVKADIGGFDVGSEITWQAAAGYDFETRFLGFPMTSHLGYRALYVDYEQGSGPHTFGLDLLTHGPVVGLSLKW